MHGLNDPPELRVRRFEAEVGFSENLCSLQQATGLEATTATLLKEANKHGFSWQFMAAEPPYVEVLLRHDEGAIVRATGTHPTAVLLGLLGCLPPDLFPSWMLEQERQEPPEAACSVVVTPEAEPAPAPEAEPAAPPAPEAEPAPASAPAPVADAATAAAESLAAATAGEVVPEAGDRSADDPLTDAEKTTAKAMIKGMAADQRRAFTIAFRHAYKVPAEQTAIAPLIVQFKHLDFIDRFTGEAAGLVRP